MRFVFRTSYRQDMSLFRDPVQRNWYVALLVGLLALPMTGVYLTIATLAFALIIQEVLTHWDGVTGGLKGKAVAKAVIFGISFGGSEAFYFLCLGFLVAGLWLTQNLLRAPTGRAWVPIRDSEIA